jgi:hypothetical protein
MNTTSGMLIASPGSPESMRPASLPGLLVSVAGPSLARTSTPTTSLPVEPSMGTAQVAVSVQSFEPPHPCVARERVTRPSVNQRRRI